MQNGSYPENGHLASNTTITASAFASTNQTGELITSGLPRHSPKDDYEAAEDSNVVRANGQIKKLLRRVRYHF